MPFSWVRTYNPGMEAVTSYLYLAGFLAVLVAWSYYAHGWSDRPSAERMRSWLWGGFTASAASALFLISGFIGWKLNMHGQLFSNTEWTGSVIWPQVGVGLALVPFAVYLLRRGAREIDRRI